MKQRWINTRMKMLHKLMGDESMHDSKRKVMNDFMQSIQPHYPKKISVSYDRSSEEPPAHVADPNVPIVMPMNVVHEDEPIPTHSKEDLEKEQTKESDK